MQDCLAANSLTTEDITLFVPHQANGKVPQLASKFGVDPQRVFFNFDKVGNTANGMLAIISIMSYLSYLIYLPILSPFDQNHIIYSNSFYIAIYLFYLSASLAIALADLVEQDTLPEGAQVMFLAAVSTRYTITTTSTIAFDSVN